MCKFCNAMDIRRKVDTIFKIKYPNEEHRYSVAIVNRTFRKGEKGCSGSSTDYIFRGCCYDLNFCPECGRRLTKNSAIDSPPEKP